MDAGLVGRDSELRTLTSAIESGSGAVLVGPAGIGKTRLATELGQAFAGRVLWMPVTIDAAALPYGPFEALVPELSTALSSDSSVSALSMIREVVADGDGPTLLVVDDAQHLDSASAAAVHALAVGGDAQVVATIREGDTVPPAITTLWKDGGFTRMDLGPLRREDADALTTELLGGVADARTMAEIWRMSRGHPLEHREVILSARETGRLQHADGVWTLVGSFDATSRLVELVEERLGRLEDDERSAAEILAYGEPLSLRLFTAATNADVVERLEVSRVARILPSAAGPQVTMLHPLYAEVLRAMLPVTRRARVAGLLAEATAAGGVRSPDPLRVTTWRLDAGTAGAEELEQAAIGAVRRMAWDLALKFATASLELAPSYMGHGCAAAALAERGDVAAAEQHLLDARELVDDPAMLAWNTISLSDVWFYHGGRMEDSLELVRKELAQTTDPELRDEIGSALAINLMMYGSVDEVAELSREVLDRSDASSAARLMALVASTSADGQLLQFGAVRSGVAAALPLVAENQHRFANAEAILHSALVAADVAAGNLAGARATVDERCRVALDTDRGDLPGFWTMFDGLVLLYEGHVDRGLEVQQQALLLLDRYDSWLSEPLARVGAAHAAALAGDARAARRHIAAIDPEMRAAPRVRSRIGHVEALAVALEGGVSAGAAAAVVAGDLGSEDRHLLWAAEAWHLAVRLGHPELVCDRLTALAEDRPGVTSTFADHARALDAGDTEQLAQVVDRFAEAGFSLFAAEAACQLAGLHRRAQEGDLARRAAAHARELLPDGSGARTPPFAELADVHPLTPREREVALLAADGITSREIAERLFISVRSVDNHLSRVYAKLGVGGRSDLRGVLHPGS